MMMMMIMMMVNTIWKLFDDKKLDMTVSCWLYTSFTDAYMRHSVSISYEFPLECVDIIVAYGMGVSDVIDGYSVINEICPRCFYKNLLVYAPGPRWTINMLIIALLLVAPNLFYWLFLLNINVCQHLPEFLNTEFSRIITFLLRVRQRPFSHTINAMVADMLATQGSRVSVDIYWPNFMLLEYSIGQMG